MRGGQERTRTNPKYSRVVWSEKNSAVVDGDNRAGKGLSTSSPCAFPRWPSAANWPRSIAGIRLMLKLLIPAQFTAQPEVE